MLKMISTTVRNRFHGKFRQINQLVAFNQTKFQCFSTSTSKNQHSNRTSPFWLWKWALAGACLSPMQSVRAQEKKTQEKQTLKNPVLTPSINNTIDRNRKSSKSSSSNSIRLKKRDTAGSSQFRISSSAVKGERMYMEDRHYISPNKRFIGVFDGHGGKEVAIMLKQKLYPYIFGQLSAAMDAKKNEPLTPEEIKAILQESVKKVQVEVLKRSELEEVGSTAVCVLLVNNFIFSINVGDSRAVLCRNGKAMDLTIDHKPNCESEKSRIESLGGIVSWHGYVDSKNNPIPDMGVYRINGHLAVSRAIGDHDQHPFVSAEPDVKYFDRNFEKDQFVILASDGLWDVISSDDAVTFVLNVLSGEVGGRGSWRSGSEDETKVQLFEWSQKYKSDTSMIQAAKNRRKTKMAEYLVQEAIHQGSSDNITAMVLWLT